VKTDKTLAPLLNRHPRVTAWLRGAGMSPTRIPEELLAYLPLGLPKLIFTAPFWYGGNVYMCCQYVLTVKEDRTVIMRWEERNNPYAETWVVPCSQLTPVTEQQVSERADGLSGAVVRDLLEWFQEHPGGHMPEVLQLPFGPPKMNNRRPFWHRGEVWQFYDYTFGGRTNHAAIKRWSERNNVYVECEVVRCSELVPMRAEEVEHDVSGLSAWDMGALREWFREHPAQEVEEA